MAIAPGLGNLVAAIDTLAGETHAGQAFQAGSVLQAWWTTRRPAQDQAVQG